MSFLPCAAPPQQRRSDGHGLKPGETRSQRGVVGRKPTGQSGVLGRRERSGPGAKPKGDWRRLQCLLPANPWPKAPLFAPLSRPANLKCCETQHCHVWPFFIAEFPGDRSRSVTYRCVLTVEVHIFTCKTLPTPPPTIETGCLQFSVLHLNSPKRYRAWCRWKP